MSLALKARQKARRKGGAKERVFGCDLLEHLQQSGQDVPQVLRSCTEFVEQHGVVDGIYRLSGVSSNIQRLRQEFDSDRCPDLQRDVYLQDIHCVSSLCKAYFRELPNPLLTYQLYDKFADAVAIQMEEARLVKIKEVLKELPAPHYRTLEFLMRHLLHMASYSSQTNMHARNLAIVWAPNLLRSKDIEATGFNGTAAFMEVRVQSIVVEFILTHVEQLFGDAPLCGGEAARRSRLLPGDGQAPYHVPAVLSQGDGPPPIRPYHTIIELGEHRRKGSLKAKKWKSIFNLGRSSHEAKRKLVKAEEKEDKCGKLSLRPAKSMDSLSSVPFGGEEDPRLSTTRSVKQPPQRRESFDTCPSPGPAEPFPALQESPEEKPKAQEELRGGPEAEGESGARSEPSTPKPGRAALLGAGGGRSPAATRSRAEKCGGVHISGPFSVTVPFHITSNLSRLTRGQPCPALGSASPPPPTHRSAGEPAAPEIPTGEAKAAEETRLSLELRASFAFLDSQDAGLEHGDGDGDAAGRVPPGGSGLEDGDGFLALEEGMEGGFMNPGEPPAEQPGSYLSIEECMDEELFYMAPSGSEPEDAAGDSDSDMFLSAHDELSPLAAEPPAGPGGVGTGTAWGSPSPPVPRDTSPSPAGEEAPGAGEHGGAPPGDAEEGGASGWPLEEEEEEHRGGGGEGTPGGGCSLGRTEPSPQMGPGAEAGAEPAPGAPDGEVEEDGASTEPPTPEQLGQGSHAPPPAEEPPSQPTDPLISEAPSEALHPPGSSPEEGSSPPIAPTPQLEAAGGAHPTPEPPTPGGAVLRRDGSAPVRLAARLVRVQQARSVPVVPPKPQFAIVPPALRPRTLPAEGPDAASPPPKTGTAPGSPVGEGAAGRRAGWREGGSVSLDGAGGAAAERQPVRRMQTYGGEEQAPGAAKALPFQRAPLRPRLLRPLSCVAAPQGPPQRSRPGPAQEEEAGEARGISRRPLGTEGVTGER
ncbi:rho GTPase-activating protein 30 isoform X2 [Anas platyrhynchos]|uniref:rho GTPase-activating protein 30 isoform X2 n=1 Tax=Anas platyrhynchos TaxID=8839 RepID=UPI003AF2BA58